VGTVGSVQNGRGAWAGPLVAAGVIFPQNCRLPFAVADSKKLSPKVRTSLVPNILSKVIAWTIVEIPVSLINKVGIGKANHIAFRKILTKLHGQFDFILVDGFAINHVAQKKQRAIIHGDAISSTIAAASIIAKVHRDTLMEQLASLYPAYGFEEHKGYGTVKHQQAIAQHGLCPIHRTSFHLLPYTAL